MYCESEKSLFSHGYLLNMDILFIITLICFEMCMFIAEICMEESTSQQFDLGLSSLWRDW